MYIQELPAELPPRFCYTPVQLHALRCTCRAFSALASPFTYTATGILTEMSGPIYTLRIARADIIAANDGARRCTISKKPADDAAVLLDSSEEVWYLHDSIELYKFIRPLLRLKSPVFTRVRGTPWPEWICRDFVDALDGQDPDETFSHNGVVVLVRIRSIVVRHAGVITVYSRMSSKNPVIIPAAGWCTMYSGCAEKLHLIAGLTPVFANSAQ